MFDLHNERKLTIPVVEDPTETEVATVAQRLESSVKATYIPTFSELQDDIAIKMANTLIQTFYSLGYSIPKFTMIWRVKQSGILPGISFV